MRLLEAKGINIAFSGTQVLHDINFSLDAGEINCLCGENGAGKSTLVKVLSGIYAHYSGEILIDGKAVQIKTPTDAVRHGIYAVQQHRDLAPTLNAVENIFLCNEKFHDRRSRRIDFSAMRRAAEGFIDKFGVKINLDVPVRDLKVSEQGIIAICKALARESRILLIDEASAPLDDSERLALYDSLQKLAAEGCGIVYITHHLDEVFRIGTKVTVLRDGFNADVFTMEALDHQKLIASMTGNVALYRREIDKIAPLPSEIALEVEHLSAEGLQDISFYVRKGEVLGIAGLEGSGKKLIAHCCFGLKSHQGGTIRKNGNYISPKTPIEAIRHNIGLVPDHRKETGLVLCKNVMENLIIVRINKTKMRFVGKRWSEKLARQYVDALRIRSSGLSQLVEYLSGGNQQKVLVAKWLGAEVDVLFLLEPTEGIDVGARADLYAIFHKIAAEGKSIVIITSDIDELMEMSHRIITMGEGRIINEYPIQEADKKQILTDILLAGKGVSPGREVAHA